MRIESNPTLLPMALPKRRGSGSERPSAASPVRESPPGLSPAYQPPPSQDLRGHLVDRYI